MKKRVKDLMPNDSYDAQPLCRKCLEPFGTDMFDDSVWVAAENLYFEVEEVEKHPSGYYVIWGYPYNMTADGNDWVEVREELQI